jgi:hypothetical protein
MTTKTLYCEAGQHEWERPAQRGRAPISCPEHKDIKDPSQLSGLEKARIARQEKRNAAESLMAERVEEVLNSPKMPLGTSTPSKLRYIQDQLMNNRSNRNPSDIADLERMRDIILKNPFTRSGHLF